MQSWRYTVNPYQCRDHGWENRMQVQWRPRQWSAQVEIAFVPPLISYDTCSSQVEAVIHIQRKYFKTHTIKLWKRPRNKDFLSGLQASASTDNHHTPYSTRDESEPLTADMTWQCNAAHIVRAPILLLRLVSYKQSYDSSLSSLSQVTSNSAGSSSLPLLSNKECM